MQFFCYLFTALCNSSQIFWTKYSISPLFLLLFSPSDTM
nr:MAG TPA: hypothetical protein [Caudoviricetes sp.]